MKFLLASLKTLNNSKSCSESHIKFLFRPSFVLIGQFFLVHSHRRVSEQLLKAQAPGSYQKSGTSSLKRVTERNFPICKWFLEASRNFILDFLHKKTTENCENHKRSFKKYCFEIYDLQKNYSSRATTPLNALKVLIVTHLPHDESRDDDDDRAERVRHDVEEDAAHVHVATVRVTVAAAVGVTVRCRRFRGRRSLLRRVHDLK